MTTKKIEASSIAILKAAKDNNFWGKRLLSVKIDVAQAIIEDLNIKCTEAEELADWLDANQPVKPAPQKRAKAEAVEVEPVFEGSLQSRDKDLPVLEDGSYIISSCSNNTLPHAAFDTLQHMAEALNANLLLMPIKYVKPLPADQRANYRYNDAFEPFIVHDDTWLGGFGQIKLAVSAAIIPTQKQPINNAATLNNDESMTIVASPKRQLKSLPRPKDGEFKWAYTTSSVSQMFYTNTAAGNLAEASHTYGGVLVEVQDGIIHHCPLVANEQGDITHNGLVYTAQGEVFEADKPAVVLGDLHCEKMCEYSWHRTMQWLDSVQPTQIAVHDALDMMSRNHHNRKSGKFLYQMGTRAVVDDLTEVINYLNELATIAPVFVVESNHDLALDSWLDCPTYNADLDPINARTYYALKLATCDMIDNGDDFTAIDLACRTLANQVPELAENVRFGRIDEAEIWNGVQVDMHGHVGLSGARGSMATFRKVGLTCVTAHTHSPAQDGSSVVVGVTGSLSMGYNKGLTAWDRANALINTDGTVQLMPLYAIGEAQY